MIALSEHFPGQQCMRKQSRPLLYMNSHSTFTGVQKTFHFELRHNNISTKLYHALVKEPYSIIISTLLCLKMYVKYLSNRLPELARQKQWKVEYWKCWSSKKPTSDKDLTTWITCKKVVQGKFRKDHLLPTRWVKFRRTPDIELVKLSKVYMGSG